MIKIGNNIFFSLEEITSEFDVKEEELTLKLNEADIKYIYLNNKGYVLESEFLSLFKELENVDEEISSNKIYPVSEKEILDETLNVLYKKKEISIKNLREYLKDNMKLSEQDLIINKNRSDTKFDQKVRNLISHRKGNGLLQYCEYKDGKLILKED